MLFIATISDKAGKTLFTSSPASTRAIAAYEAFTARPRAKTCSTCKATEGDERSHMGIEWHNRADVCPVDLTTLSAPKLSLLISKVSKARGVMIDRVIAAGMGAMTGRDIREFAKGSSMLANVNLAREYVKVADEFHAVMNESDARKRYHGGKGPIKR